MISLTVLSRRPSAMGRWKSFTATSLFRFLSINSQVSATAPRPMALTALCEACTVILTILMGMSDHNQGSVGRES